MATADKIAEGVPSHEARRLALVELGGIEQVKEGVRNKRHGAFLDDVGRDVRYAFRLFARERTFAVVIVGTLALGIGGNTAFFSIVDSLLLRTLPVEEPARLARLVDAPSSGQQSWTYPIWQEIQRHADRFDGRPRSPGQPGLPARGKSRGEEDRGLGAIIRGLCRTC